MINKENQSLNKEDHNETLTQQIKEPIAEKVEGNSSEVQNTKESEQQSESAVEIPFFKTLKIFKDQNSNERSVSKVSWHPKGPTKIAVSYANLRFQQTLKQMPTQAYVWDLLNSKAPQLALLSPSALTHIAYNQKIPDQIGGGLQSGILAIWDERKGKMPIMISPVEQSHSDPITNFMWLMSKEGNECVTTSTDGKVLWWDTRKIDSGPVEKLNIFENTEDEQLIGGTCLEYNVEAAPNKLLIGTELGSVLTTLKKPQKPVEISCRYGLDSGRHLGPIYSINRSNQDPKYFLSVGDWSCNIWIEDMKIPFIHTKYHNSYLSDGCWSPTRFGVFFLTRKDGWLDVWDYYKYQNQTAYSHKVSDSPLTCIKINQTGSSNHTPGKLCAIGDQEGNLTILELSEALFTPQPNEKEVISEIFEREIKKEKNLEVIKKKQDLAKQQVNRESTATQKERWEKKKEEMIAQAEKKFLDNLAKIPIFNQYDQEGQENSSHPFLSQNSNTNEKEQEQQEQLLHAILQDPKMQPKEVETEESEVRKKWIEELVEEEEEGHTEKKKEEQ